jgi:single-stranded DNA-binding protein
MNNAMIAGRLIADPRREPAQEGEAVSVLSIAVPQPVSEDSAQSHRLFEVEVRGALADVCMASFKIGSQLAVVGRLEPWPAGDQRNSVLLNVIYVSPVADHS